MDKQAFIHHFNHLNRRDFIPEPFKVELLLDTPYPIGFGQSTSQPSLIQQMILILDPEPTDTVLEIGTGSGYLTALLSPFVSRIYSVERIKELSKQAQTRLTQLGYLNIDYIITDGTNGYPSSAPYDRIIVSAACNEIPPSLINQLNVNGKLLIPVGQKYSQRLNLVEKDKMGNITKTDMGGVVFVELIGEFGFRPKD